MTDSKKNEVLRHEIRDLRRVRNIAALVSAVETLKILPGIDAAVVALEWVVLKNILPMGLSLLDDMKAGTFSVGRVMSVAARENWLSLNGRAFGASGGLLALAIDAGTDGTTLALPAPLDGFDIPSTLVDAGIAAYAHKRLKAAEKELDENRAHETPAVDV